MWTKPMTEIVQLIGPDGEVFDLTTESEFGNWVLEQSGWGMPPVDYISQQGPFQHGVSVRDYRLKPRSIQLLLRQQACDRNNYWDRRTQLLNSVRPNRDPVGLAGAWIARSQENYETENRIYSLCVYNNKLYGGTSQTGLLFEWDGISRWVKVADQLVAQTAILSLVVYDDGGGEDIYGGTTPGGNLFRWDGSSSWIQISPITNGQTNINAMVVFEEAAVDYIFAGTSPGGRLFRSNGGVWVQRCAQLGTETQILSLAVYDDGGGDDLYGGTGPNGMLYIYNPSVAWVQVCAQFGAESHIRCLCVYQGKLYGGTSGTGLLLEYDVAGGQWIQAAAQYGAEAHIYDLVVYQGRLYGLSGTSGLLLRWNGSNAWELAAGQYGGEAEVRASLIHNNRLFGGSYDGAYLLEYIRRSGSTELPCFTLRRILSDGSIRDLCVHIDNGPVFSSPEIGWDEHGIKELIRFWAPNPIVYDPEEQDGPTYTMDPLATGAVNETQTVEYEGTWEEHPTLVLTGPMDNPIIWNNDTDEFIELDYNIPAGRVITIDLTPGNQTVEDDLGINFIGSITPESNLASFHLAPDPEVIDGGNDINIIATGTNANSDFSISYYNRYIGI